MAQQLPPWHGFPSGLRTYSAEMQKDLRDLERFLAGLRTSVATLIAEEPISVASTVAVTTDRQVIAGAGLTGGGTLAADVTLNVGAGTGISVTADAVSIASGYLGADPTASVGNSVVVGSATTYMRSDASPALDLTLARNWSAGVHTFAAQDVHNAGVSLGMSGDALSAVDDGAAAIAFDFQDTVARTQGYTASISNTALAGAPELFVLSWDGRYSFGYGALDPVIGHILSFTQSDANSPTGAPHYAGALMSVRHNDTAETAARLLGAAGSAVTTTPTGLPEFTYGLVGTAGGNNNATGYSTKYCAGVVGKLAHTQAQSWMEPNVIDQEFQSSQYLAGDWAHAAALWADIAASTSTIGAPTNKPAITSGLRVGIMDYGGSTTSASPARECWAIYGENFQGSAANYPLTTGFLRMPYPRRTAASAGTTRGTQIWWEPWPNTTTIRGNAAIGDTYFDDGTNFASGLWQRDSAGWVKLLNDDLVFYDDEIISYDDESVGYH